MILVLSVRLAGRLHWHMQAYAPSDIAIRHIYGVTGPRLKLPIVMAAVVLYLGATRVLTAAVEHGAPGWLNLLVLVCAWNSIRFSWLVVVRLVAQSARLVGGFDRKVSSTD